MRQPAKGTGAENCQFYGVIRLPLTDHWLCRQILLKSQPEKNLLKSFFRTKKS
jgi:hypothetical protein